MGPLRHSQHMAVRDALADAARLGWLNESQPWFALTRNRAGTFRVLLLTLAAFGAGTLVRGLSSSWRRRVIRVLLLLGAAVGILGYLGQWVFKQGFTLWWYFPVPPILPGPVGGFINRNHFGGFLALLCPMAIGLMADDWAARRRGAVLLDVACLGAMVYALAWSLSRGAWLAFAGGVLVALFRLERRRVAPLLAIISVLVLLGLTLVRLPAFPVLRQRIETLRAPLDSTSAEKRLNAWREIPRIWLDYPVVGIGPNALRMIYPQYRWTTSGQWLVHAENHYIEWAVDTGLVGTIVLALMGISLALTIRHAGGPPLANRGVVAGSAGAVTVAALHAAVDFALLVPLYATALAILIAVRLPPLRATTDRPWTAGRTSAIPSLAALLIAVTLHFRPGGAVHQMDAHEFLQQADPPALRTALVWAPTSWHAWYYLGRAACEEAVRRNDIRLSAFGEECVTQAAAYDPNNYRLWHELGILRMNMGLRRQASEAFRRAQSLRPWMTPPPEWKDN